jgi:N-carbamoylputrescine amidase
MLKIAGIQMKCSKDPQANLKKAVEMIGLAAERGAGIIATPQLFTLPWFAFESQKDHFQWAESIEGPTVSTLREEARKHRVVLIGTFFEKDGDSFYNTAAVIEKDGTLLGRYRKVHLPQIPLWEEKFYFKPGDLGFPVFQTSAARIGVQICWDNFFPEGSRLMALHGAQIIIAPTAAAFASQSRWEKMICANAIANNVFILRINRAGKEERQTFYGRSFCVNPFGELIGAPAGANDAILFSELDLNEVEETRGLWTFLKDRRPELYHGLSQP